jgi:hypothetical protein
VRADGGITRGDRLPALRRSFGRHFSPIKQFAHRARWLTYRTLAARAQEPGRIFRFGFLGLGRRDEPTFIPMFETRRQSGFIEGQNMIVDWRAFADQVDRVPELAAELVEAKPDILYASGHFAMPADISHLGPCCELHRTWLARWPAPTPI